MVAFLSWAREFTHLIFLANLFSMGVPPDAITLRRAFAYDPIGEPVSRNEKGLTGVRTFKGSDALVIETACRKNLMGGCIVKRICMRIPQIPGMKAECPHRRIRPLIRWVEAGELFLPSFTKNNFNRHLAFARNRLNFMVFPGKILRNSVDEPSKTC